jgi:hypothetical protein
MEKIGRHKVGEKRRRVSQEKDKLVCETGRE